MKRVLAHSPCALMSISRADTITICSQGCDHSCVIADVGGNALSTRCPDCRADIDCRDGVVDTGDLGFLLASENSSDPPCDLTRTVSSTASTS